MIATISGAFAMPHRDAVGAVVAVHRSPGHTFSKPPQGAIQLLVGLGVEGDAHKGTTVNIARW
jgi:hypothetical protein